MNAEQSGSRRRKQAPHDVSWHWFLPGTTGERLGGRGDGTREREGRGDGGGTRVKRRNKETSSKSLKCIQVLFCHGDNALFGGNG